MPTKIGKSIYTKKRVTKAEKEKMVGQATRYGRKTSVDTTNKEGKAYKQKPVPNPSPKADAKRSALAAGKRITTWGTKYTETRVNRSDKRK
jgi:hypothetical protein